MTDLVALKYVYNLSPQLDALVDGKSEEELQKLAVKAILTVVSWDETSKLTQNFPGFREVLYVSGPDVMFDTIPLTLFITLCKKTKQFEIFMEVLNEDYWDRVKGGMNPELN